MSQSRRPKPHPRENAPAVSIAAEWQRKFPLLKKTLGRVSVRNPRAIRRAAQEISVVHQEFVDNGNSEKVWRHFERAHMLTHQSSIAHFLIHLMMMIYAAYTRNWGETFGQIPRLFLSIPMSVLGLIPRGNTGLAKMRIFEKGNVPADLVEFVDETTDGTPRK
ncbi:MAG: DUF3703 domain-containing protein [Bdellovibrionales bacterium]|nr:DUF3703 domain-containing protein [Bdellovibrionales bacterium]